MRHFLLSLILFGLFAASSSAQDRPVEPSNVLGRMLGMKPDPALLQWQRIPWARTLRDAIRMAKQEKRPLFFWASDDEPLDRC
jgi:hypothetical protein